MDALPLTPATPGSTAQRLGHAGLVPFGAGAALVWLVHDEVRAYVALALSAYAALVLSFLGGIHWGLAMRQPPPPAAGLWWGAVPLAVAWPALMMPPRSGLVIQALMLLACYAADRRLYPPLGAASWLTLRFRFSALGSLGCFIGAAGS